MESQEVREAKLSSRDANRVGQRNSKGQSARSITVDVRGSKATIGEEVHLTTSTPFYA